MNPAGRRDPDATIEFLDRMLDVVGRLQCASRDRRAMAGPALREVRFALESYDVYGSNGASVPDPD